MNNALRLGVDNTFVLVKVYSRGVVLQHMPGVNLLGSAAGVHDMTSSRYMIEDIKDNRFS